MYQDENDGNMSSATYEGRLLIGGMFFPVDWPWPPAGITNNEQTLAYIKERLELGPLWPYASSHDVYNCPGDEHQVAVGQGLDVRYLRPGGRA